MSLSTFDAVRRKYNFEAISIANWIHPAASVRPAAYKVKLDLLPQPTDDEASNAGDSKNEPEMKGDVEEPVAEEHEVCTVHDDKPDMDLQPPLERAPSDVQTQNDAQSASVVEGSDSATTAAATSPEEAQGGIENGIHVVENDATVLGDVAEQMAVVETVADQPAPPEASPCKVATNDSSDDRRVTFAPGTPNPEPTLRKNRPSKGSKARKKKPAVLPNNLLQDTTLAIPGAFEGTARGLTPAAPSEEYLADKDDAAQALMTEEGAHEERVIESEIVVNDIPPWTKSLDGSQDNQEEAPASASALNERDEGPRHAVEDVAVLEDGPSDEPVQEAAEPGLADTGIDTAQSVGTSVEIQKASASGESKTSKKKSSEDSTKALDSAGLGIDVDPVASVDNKTSLSTVDNVAEIVDIGVGLQTQGREAKACDSGEMDTTEIPTSCDGPPEDTTKPGDADVLCPQRAPDGAMPIESQSPADSGVGFDDDHAKAVARPEEVSAATGEDGDGDEAVDGSSSNATAKTHAVDTLDPTVSATTEVVELLQSADEGAPGIRTSTVILEPVEPLNEVPGTCGMESGKAEDGIKLSEGSDEAATDPAEEGPSHSTSEQMAQPLKEDQPALDVPPSPILSKSSSRKSRKHKRDHWERKHVDDSFREVFQDSKVLERPHIRRDRGGDQVRVRDRAPRSRRYSASSEDHEERRKRRAARRREEAVRSAGWERKKAEESRTRQMRRAEAEVRATMGARRTRGSERRISIRSDGDTSDQRGGKKTLALFTLPKALSLTSGSSVHGSSVTKPHGGPHRSTKEASRSTATRRRNEAASRESRSQSVQSPTERKPSQERARRDRDYERSKPSRGHREPDDRHRPESAVQATEKPPRRSILRTLMGV